MADGAIRPREPNPRRQAAHTIRAFWFQLLETAIAWMNLAEDATLLIEIFEDFDVVTAGGKTKLTQVKHSQRKRKLTLASKEASEVLENYWSTSREGQATDVSLVVHTNMAIGTERGVALPGNTKGIEYWQKVQDGADINPLKNLLLEKLPAGDLKKWLAGNPDDDAVRTMLVDRVDWKLDQPSGAQQKAHLVNLIVEHLKALGLPVGLALRATETIVIRIGETAIETDPALRRLTTADRDALLQEVFRLGQPGHKENLTLASWTVPIEDIATPVYLASRTTLVGELSSTLADIGALWLHGASGTGKSTLALQVARSNGQRWLVAEFSDQAEVSDVLERLDQAYIDTVQRHGVSGIILDDIDSDIVARHVGRISRFITLMRQRNGCVVFTSARMPSPAALQSAGLSLVSAKEAPYLTIEETLEIVAQTNAPSDQVEALGRFVYASASGGHPQLVAAKVVSLEHRAWPQSGPLEDLLIGPSEANQLTREEARRRLFDDANKQGRTLLKRLECILFKFDRASAIAIAALDPKIDDAAACLDQLTGPWIEKVATAPGYFRLSPLLSGLSEDLGEEEVQRIQEGFLFSTVKRGIPYEMLDSVFWTAFVSKQGWFFTEYFKDSLSFDENKSKAIAAKLGLLVYLRTDQLLLPDDPVRSLFLRLIQVDVAELNGEKELFQSIAIAAIREAAESIDERRNALIIMALFRILFRQGMKLDWDLRLTWISDFEVLANKYPDLVNRNQGLAVQAMEAKFGDVADVSSIMLSIGVSAMETPDDLKAFFTALDELESALRERRLLQLKSLFKGYGFLVEPAWASTWSADNINAEAAISQYGDMADMAARWRDDDLVAECIVVQSVLWDEFQHDRVTALDIVDDAFKALPDHPVLLRQKAKVLGHDCRYGEARSILESIRTRTDDRPDIERMYAIKEQAVATANTGEIERARDLFLEAAAAAESVEEESVLMRAYGVALRAEAAICSWRSGYAERALRELAPLVDGLKQIDPGAHDAAKILHRNIRWAVLWLNEKTGSPVGLQHELSYGVLSTLEADYPDDEEDRSVRHEDIKLLLTIVGLRKGVRDLFLGIECHATTLGFHVWLAAAEFDIAVDQGAPSSVSQAVLELTAAFNAAKEQDWSPTPIIEKSTKIEACELENSDIRVVFTRALALAAFIGGRDQDAKRDYCRAILTEMTKAVGDAVSSLVRFDRILSGIIKAEATDPAELVFSFAISPSVEALHPAAIFKKQLALLRCAVGCGCEARMMMHIHTLFADEWSHVLQNQMFLLAQPMLNVPALEGAIEHVRKGEAGALRNLLQTGGRALNLQVPEGLLDSVEKLGGKGPN